MKSRIVLMVLAATFLLVGAVPANTVLVETTIAEIGKDGDRDKFARRNRSRPLRRQPAGVVQVLHLRPGYFRGRNLARIYLETVRFMFPPYASFSRASRLFLYSS